MMLTQDTERLMNDARIKLQGSSDQGIKAELYNVIQEFFQDSNAWTEAISVNLIGGTQDYTITPSAGMILRLVNVIDANFLTYPALLTSLQPPSAILHITWPQNQPQLVMATVVKNVVQPLGAHEFPDAPESLLQVYYQAILDGLLGKMKAQQGKSWTDISGANYNLKRFEMGKSMAKVATMRSNLFGGQSWRFPQTFRTISQRGGVSTPFPSDQGFGV